MTSPEDIAAKRRFIDAYFVDLDDKVRFLTSLHDDQGRRDEARMLCSVYLDGLGNWLSPHSTETARNFCTVLMGHGGETVLALILPGRLAESLPFRSAPTDYEVAIRAALAALPTNEAFDSPELVGRVGSSLSQDQLAWLQRELWRGTIASVVHERIRSPNVHWLGSSGGIAFSRTVHQGRLISDVGFGTLHRALVRVTAHARSLSASTDTWFGHA